MMNKQILIGLEDLQAWVARADAIRWWNPSTWMLNIPERRICELMARSTGITCYDMREGFLACVQSTDWSYPVAGDDQFSWGWDYLWSKRSETGLNRRKLLQDMINFYRKACGLEIDNDPND